MLKVGTISLLGGLSSLYSLIILLLLFVLGLCQAAFAKKGGKSAKKVDQRERLIGHNLRQYLESYHYRRMKIDNGVSHMLSFSGNKNYHFYNDYSKKFKPNNKNSVIFDCKLNNNRIDLLKFEEILEFIKNN